MDIVRRIPQYAQHHQQIAPQLNYLQRQFPSLAPKQTELWRDGRNQIVVAFGGTLPVPISGKVYNIPVEIYVPHGFPQLAPLAFVRPTREMMIQGTQAVRGEDGQVFLPYLHTWSPQTHTMLQLAQEMIGAFGRAPPVYARPPSQPYTPPAVPVSGSGAAAAARTGSSHSGSGGGRGGAGGGITSASSTSGAVTEKERLIARLSARLGKEIQEACESVAMDIDVKKGEERSLKEAQSTVDAGIAELQHHKQALNSQLVELQQHSDEVDTWLQLHSSASATVDVDDLIECADDHSEQMLELMAESASIDDVLYELDRAVKHDQLELPVYLKKVRTLCRRQFICKALIARVYDEQLDRVR